MADGENSSNTAIVALIVLGLAVVAGVFIYYQGGFGDTVVHTETIIEKQAPAPADEPGYKLEHEDESGNKTVIEAP